MAWRNLYSNRAKDTKPKKGSLQQRSIREDSMRKPAALFVIALALGAMILAPLAGARADGREEGPFEIEKCQTIDKPGSYKLVNNLTLSAIPGTCLLITADFVTIDLAGFTITGPGIASPFGPGSVAIMAPFSSSGSPAGIAVRNGSISNFNVGVSLGDGSIVEGLRVSRCGQLGIGAAGIVRGNTVDGCDAGPSMGDGIDATGTVTGNTVTRTRLAGLGIGQGSTVIGNTSVNQTSEGPSFGMIVGCPSNVTDNTTNSTQVQGDGCLTTNNVAP
jgi:hypothetical protein